MHQKQDKVLEEFTVYYEKHKTAIFNYILYRVGFNRDTAEDLTSDIFLKAFEHFEKYDRERPFKTWIFTIAHNHLVNYYIAKKDTLPLEEAIEVVKESSSVSQDTEHSMTVAKILHLVSELPDQQKEIVIMKYVDDMTNEEIAGTLGKEEGTVRTALSRAIASLRNKYNFQISPNNNL